MWLTLGNHCWLSSEPSVYLTTSGILTQVYISIKYKRDIYKHLIKYHKFIEYTEYEIKYLKLKDSPKMFIYEASIIHRQDTSLLKGTTTNNSQKWSPPQAMRSDSKADEQIKSSQ